MESIPEESVAAPDAAKDLGVGKEQPIIKSGVMKVTAVEIETVNTKSGDKEIAQIYGDVEGLKDRVKISKVKCIEPRSNKLKVLGLWITKDSDGKIASNSALAVTLKKFKVQKLKDLEGKELPLTSDDEGFLVVKAY